MNNTVFMILKMLLAISPFLLLCWLNNKANLKKEKRSKQFLMPILSIIISLVLMFYVDDINTALIRFIQKLPAFLNNLVKVNWMPEGIGSMLAKFVKWFKDAIVNGLNLKFWIFFISNTLLFLGYIIVKKIAVVIMGKAFKNDNEFFSGCVYRFYEYNDDKAVWCLKDGYAQARILMKSAYIGVIVIAFSLMLISKTFYDKGTIKSLFYPIFSVMVVGELYFFLNGMTLSEYLENILGEDDNAAKVVNYTLLRKYLKKLYPDKLLAEGSTVNNSLANVVTNEEIVEELLGSEDAKMEAFGIYLNALNASGFELDNNYIHSTIDLLNGKSVLFNNPFYYDLIPYAFYPMNRTLLNHDKVLVVLGRQAIEEDVIEWIKSGLTAVNNIPTLWDIGLLGDKASDLDVGIIKRSDVNNLSIQDANADFFKQVTFCVIIEPSKLITTAQIGLNSIVKKCMIDRDNKAITFCACDKNCDGLIDSLSHVVLKSLTEVSATNVHRGTSSFMSWSADNDFWQHRIIPNISRYLGIGTELSLAAIKNQVSKATWYGGESFPVSDMRWISRQYYSELLKFAGLPVNQDEMEKCFIADPNYLEAKKEENNYMIVEDEANNMFEVLRNFSTRATSQSFVNILSGDYLLKDYMAQNDKIFRADSKAIPYLVADYARTNRNVILRLILMMSCGYVSEEQIISEFSLIGIQPYRLKEQLWHEIYKCYSDLEAVNALPQDYDVAVKSTKDKYISLFSKKFGIALIHKKEHFNIATGKVYDVYYITDRKFVELCINELKSAEYIAEDEKNDEFYLGEELRGHIFQKYLPGQFFTFAGKYYEVISITSDNNLIVRRAADHITGRYSYRQVRHYTLSGVTDSQKMGDRKVISGIKITKAFADITVDTPSYFRMQGYNDFSTAKQVEINGIPQRVYKNKSILKIEFEENEKFTYEVRYTITTLMNELFRTLFADNQSYIVAVTNKTNAPVQATNDCEPELQADPVVEESAQPLEAPIDQKCTQEFEPQADKAATDTEEPDFEEQAAQQETIHHDDFPLTYHLKAQDENDCCIYIIEDSQLDLGLLIAVERNLKRIFEIITDYLDWNALAIEQSLHPPVIEKPQLPVFTPVAEESEEKPKKKGKVRSILDKIKSVFKKKRKKVAQEPEEPAATPQSGADGQQPDDTVPQVVGGEAPADSTAEAAQSTAYQSFRALYSTSVNPGNLGVGEEQQEAANGAESLAQTVVEETVAASAEEATAEAEPVASGAQATIAETPVEETEATKPAEKVVWEDPEEPASAAEETETVQPATDLEEVPQSEAIPDEKPTTQEIEPAEESGAAEDVPEEDTAQELPTDEGVVSTEEKAPMDISGEDEVVVEKAVGLSVKPYHERYYLLFGFDRVPQDLDLEGTYDFLTGFGFERNFLKEARECKDIAELIANGYNPNEKGKRFCDFCGSEIYGTEFEVLADGRERCMQCSKTAIKTGDEFVTIFKQVKKNVEAFYGININAPVAVKMVNSKKLHKRLGESFVPTSGFDARVLGVAIKDKSGYSLYIENGSPRMQSMLTMAHELTHIWQYLNWDDKEIVAKYGSNMRLEVYEGMAKWAEIQYAYLINEPEVAKREEILTALRQDEYGRGFLKYLDKYPLTQGTIITKETPFVDPKNPL